MRGPEHPEAACLGHACGPQALGISASQGQLPLLLGEPGALPQSQGLPTLSFQELNANLSNLTSAFEKATAEKIKCQQEADATNRVISLANRCLTPTPSQDCPVLRPTTPERDEPTEQPWGISPRCSPAWSTESREDFQPWSVPRLPTSPPGWDGLTSAGTVKGGLSVTGRKGCSGDARDTPP